MLFQKKKHLVEHQVVMPGCAQNIGKREQQQDAFGFSEFDDSELTSQVGYMAVLADGMGGLEGGQEASQAAVASILSTYTNKSLSEKISDALLRSLHKANNMIGEMANTAGSKGNMGTTAVCCTILKGQLYYACVGDSRLYLVKEQRIMQLNEDHNYGLLLDEKADRGILTWEEADEDPKRGHLISYLGIDDLEYISSNEDPLQLYEGDIVLMCSDGLTNGLNDYEIHQLIKKHISKTSQEITDALVEATLKLEKKYQDNITVLILKYKGESV